MGTWRRHSDPGSPRDPHVCWHWRPRGGQYVTHLRWTGTALAFDSLQLRLWATREPPVAACPPSSLEPLVAGKVECRVSSGGGQASARRTCPGRVSAGAQGRLGFPVHQAVSLEGVG